MSNTRYILFTGSMQPKNPMLATEDKIKEIVGAGFRQGKDFDIVSEKVLKDKLGKRGGGMMNMDEMTRPLGYKFGTEDGTLVGDRERDLKEWEEDAIDRLKKSIEREKFIEKFLEKIPDMEKEGKEEKKELPDWVKEFLEKRREDPDRFKRLLPKKEDEGEPFYRFNPDRFGPYFGPEKGPDRFLWPPKGGDPRYERLPYYNLPERFGPGEFGTRPRVNPELGPYIIRPDDPPFDPEKDIELLGDETSGLMEDSSGINILGMKLLLQEAADSLDEIDRIDRMSPDEIIREFELMQNKVS